jgi:hypothetical protein
LYVIDFSPTDGTPYINNSIDVPEFERAIESAIVGSSLFVANYDSNNIGKINLGASIDIPAGQTTGTLVLSAFKDPLSLMNLLMLMFPALQTDFLVLQMLRMSTF